MATERPGEPWTAREVRRTVEDYLDMLADELAGRPYSKAAHRRALLEDLPARTEGAIEYKHQNISAVMQLLGLPSIRGYVPAWNVQSSIADIVREVIAVQDVEHRMDLPELARERAASYDVGEVVEADAVRAEDPTRTLTRSSDLGHEARLLGLAGEELIVGWERRRLAAAGLPDLAERVVHVAREHGDGAGFDIQSWTAPGVQRLIEVKTTASVVSKQFIVTPNELRVSERQRERYWLYRVYDFWHARGLATRAGPLSEGIDLRPSQYVGALAAGAATTRLERGGDA